VEIGVVERGAKMSSFFAVRQIAEVISVNYYELFLPEMRMSVADPPL